jgi:phytoene dehydrogenase-like protein
MASDAIIVGGGHNGLVAATLLARAGRRVLLLERADQLGGAAVSESPFPGVDVRLSRYSYLVSLFPSRLRAAVAPGVELLTRRISSYTPVGDTGVLISNEDDDVTRASMARAGVGAAGPDNWRQFHGRLARAAPRLEPTLTEPLASATELKQHVHDDELWESLVERPLSHTLEASFESDVLRGIVLTDATIGTFAPADDEQLRQNRCFLYHVIGDGSGLWKVPVGGMGALTGALAEAARAAGAELRTGAEVTAIATDGSQAEITCSDGSRHRSTDVLANVAPAILNGLLDDPRAAGQPAPEGSQLKLNLLLRRLPRLRDPQVTPEDAFGGTFHVNEGYEQLQRAYEQAAAGQVPSLAPCELYCHSLTDPSILSAELRAAGAQTLTVFGLHMPARLFAADPSGAKAQAVQSTINSINSVLAEDLRDCLYRTPDGEPCIEARTPAELERELALPGGHIFHRDLQWPFAETDDEVGTWGVETAHPNIWLCGAGARRGGGVSGLPGHNAARAVLAVLDHRPTD